MTHLTKKIPILDDFFSKKAILSVLGFAAIITFAAVGLSGWNQMVKGQVHLRSYEVMWKTRLLVLVHWTKSNHP